MLDASTESLAGTSARPLQNRAKGRTISVSDHLSRPVRSARVTSCGAPFLACSNSIMQGEDGVSRCNSPFLYCERYVDRGDSRDACSSSATKNLRESMIGTK
jgi:hypothetical protein